MASHRFTILEGSWAVVKLDAESSVPDWALGPSRFSSITRTAEELSLVCAESAVPKDSRGERGWSVLKLVGPFPFDLVGVLASFVSPLAEAGISIFALSTFDTDYLLVKSEKAHEAVSVLTRHGHEFVP